MNLNETIARIKGWEEVDKFCDPTWRTSDGHCLDLPDWEHDMNACERDLWPDLEKDYYVKMSVHRAATGLLICRLFLIDEETAEETMIEGTSNLKEQHKANAEAFCKAYIEARGEVMSNKELIDSILSYETEVEDHIYDVIKSLQKQVSDLTADLNITQIKNNIWSMRRDRAEALNTKLWDALEKVEMVFRVMATAKDSAKAFEGIDWKEFLSFIQEALSHSEDKGEFLGDLYKGAVVRAPSYSKDTGMMLIPVEMVLVPVEPTEEIIEAMAEIYDPTWGYSDGEVGKSWAKESYKAMIQASKDE